VGKYSGLPGDYYYSKKVWALKAQASAKRKGFKTRLTGSRGHWHLVVKK